MATTKIEYSAPQLAAAANIKNQWGTLVYNAKAAPYLAQGDGTTDDTSAIQTALNAANTAGGGIVRLPPGTYKTTSSLTIYANTILQGSGPKLSIISFTGTATNTIVVGGQYIRIESLYIKNTVSKQAGSVGVYGTDKYFFAMRDVVVEAFDYCIKMDKSIYHTYEEVECRAGNYGFYFWGAAGSWNVDWFNNAIKFIRCISNSHTYTAFYIKGAGVDFDTCDAETNNIGWHIVGDSLTQLARGVRIHNLYAETTTTVMIKCEYAVVDIDTGTVQGNGSGTALDFLLASNSIVTINNVGTQDYFRYLINATNSSDVYVKSFFTGNTKYNVSGSQLKDGTSNIYSVNYFSSPGFQPTTKEYLSKDINYQAASVSTYTITLDANYQIVDGEIMMLIDGFAPKLKRFTATRYNDGTNKDIIIIESGDVNIVLTKNTTTNEIVISWTGVGSVSVLKVVATKN